jgi:hypothetical protein
MANFVFILLRQTERLNLKGIRKYFVMRKSQFLNRLWVWGCIILSPLSAQAQEKEETEPAPASHLAEVILPGGAQRVLEKSIPADINTMLASLLQVAGPQAKQGRNEVLAWRGNGYTKARAPQLMQDVATAVRKGGWEYKASADNTAFTIISLVKAKPTPRALVGVWVPADEALILAWTEMLGADQAPVQNETPNQPTEPAPVVADTAPAKPTQNSVAATPTGATILEVGNSTVYVNVMKTAMPKLPTFPAVTPKAGFVRGYVKDITGKPLPNARIGVRSTAVGGAYSGAQGKTDTKGYYEIAVPFGAAHFYNAGYAIDYGDGRAALGLHPADGELDGFASNVGGVENFVLMPYGIADRDDVQDNPRYLNNYYGGSVVLSYNVADERPIFASPSDLPPNSVIEFTLTPQTPLLDNSQGKTFVIRKNVGTSWGQLYVVNIPIATYRVEAKIVGGGALKMKEVGPNGGTAFGIDPKEGASSATLQLRPSTAKAEMVTAAHGNWEHVSIALSR